MQAWTKEVFKAMLLIGWHLHRFHFICLLSYSSLIKKETEIKTNESEEIREFFLEVNALFLMRIYGSMLKGGK